MRVLLISGSYPPIPCGIGDYTAQLAKSLCQHEGVSVGILTSASIAGVKEKDVELLPVMHTWGIREALTVARGIRAWRPDVVHVQYPTHQYREIQWILPFISHALGVPVVQTWHEYYSPKNWPMALNAILPGGLVAVRPCYMEKMPAWFRRLNFRKKFCFIPNASSIPAVRLTEAERAAVRQKMGINNGLISYFGFASPGKGIEMLFEAADPARHKIVLICNLSNTDDYQASILALTRGSDWAGKVTVTGFLPPFEAGRIMAASDAVVFPFRDGAGEWNSSIHAATVQGTFVLTTSTEHGGYDPKKNIYCVVPGDARAMRDALRDNAGKRIPPAEGNPWDLISRAHVGLYRSVAI